MPLIYQHRIYRADLKANPYVLYVFGDNERRYGMGGQAAEMRGEPNAVGVATLAAPGRYWHESDVKRQCAVINADLAPVRVQLAMNGIVVFPLDGIGTGLADLKNQSPTTFKYLTEKIMELANGTFNVMENGPQDPAAYLNDPF